jgi:hypothetical protein
MAVSNWVFQLTEDDVERSSTLDEDDIGKWCYLVNGCYFGFLDNKEDAQERLNAILYQSAE